MILVSNRTPTTVSLFVSLGLPKLAYFSQWVPWRMPKSSIIKKKIFFWLDFFVSKNIVSRVLQAKIFLFGLQIYPTPPPGLSTLSFMFFIFHFFWEIHTDIHDFGLWTYWDLFRNKCRDSWDHFGLLHSRASKTVKTHLSFDL